MIKLKRAFPFIIGGFILINAVLIFIASPDGPVTSGADAAQYLHVSIGFLKYGKIVDFKYPDIPFAFGTPLYSLFLAIFLKIFTFNNALKLIVVSQLVLLYLTSHLTRYLIEPFAPRMAYFAQLLVLFNPNSLITAHLIQSETIFTLLLTGAICCCFAFAKRFQYRYAIAVGFLTGLAAMTRPVGLYLIPFIPITMAILGWKNSRLGRFVKSGMIGMIFASIVVCPWFVRNHYHFGEYFFTTNAGAYLHDQYVVLHQIGHGGSTSDIAKHAETIEDMTLSKMGQKNSSEMSASEKSQFLAEVYLPEIMKERPYVHLKALTISWAHLFFDGGAGNYKNYLGLKGQSLHEIFVSRKWTGVFDAASYLFTANRGFYFVLFGVFMAFTIVARFLGLAAFVSIFQRDVWRYGILMTGILFFFSSMYLYLGNSRFRVPLEPILAVYAAVGVDVLRDAMRRKRRQHKSFTTISTTV